MSIGAYTFVARRLIPELGKDLVGVLSENCGLIFERDVRVVEFGQGPLGRNDLTIGSKKDPACPNRANKTRQLGLVTEGMAGGEVEEHVLNVDKSLGTSPVPVPRDESGIGMLLCSRIHAAHVSKDREM